MRNRKSAAKAAALITNDTMTEPMRMLVLSMPGTASMPSSEGPRTAPMSPTDVSTAPMISATPNMIAARRSRAFSST